MVVARDGQFLLGDVPRKPQHLHPVQQRPRDGIQLIGGADEQHLGQIYPHVQVVVQKLRVLFRVQHLQQGRGGVALEGRTDLVDFVEHDHRVGHFHILQRLHKLARHGADIGPAMPLDLRFIAHATEAETVEFAPQCICHGAPDAGFADPGRPDQQQNGPADLPFECPHGKELEYAPLDVVQPVVVCIQRLPRVGELKIVRRGDAPGQLRGPVEIVARHTVFR